MTLLGMVASAPVTTMSAVSLPGSDLVPSQILLWVCAVKMLYIAWRRRCCPEIRFLPFLMYTLLSIPLAFFVHDWIVGLDGHLVESGFAMTQLTQWEHLFSAILCCYLVLNAVKHNIVNSSEVLNAVNAGLIFVLLVALLQFLFTPDMITPLFRNAKLANFKHAKDRLSSTFFEPSFLSAYLMPLTAINSIYFISRPSPFLGLLVVAALVITMQNYSSTGLIGLAAVVCFAFYELVKRASRSDNKKRVIVVSSLIVCAAIILIMSSGLFDRAMGKLFQTISGKGESGSTRVANILVMGAAFLRHPLFGVGFGTGRCESLLFTWLPELGIVGLSLFVVPLIRLMKKLFGIDSAESRALLGALSVFILVYIVSVSEIYHLTFWILLGLAFSLEGGEIRDCPKRCFLQFPAHRDDTTASNFFNVDSRNNIAS